MITNILINVVVMSLKISRYIFVGSNSYLMVTQEIIKKYLIPNGGKQALLSSALGSLIWEKPTWTDFNQLSKYTYITL